MNTDHLFEEGRLTIVMDGQFGSSGKGKVASYIGEHSDRWSFCCNAFSAQAGHWVRLDDGREFFYQHLNSVGYMTDKYEKMYIGPASCIELPAILSEIEQNGVRPDQLGIARQATIILDMDQEFERGTMGFDGAPLCGGRGEGTSKFGSTNHGVGSCGARKMLRRPSVVTAGDCPDLKPYICDVPGEIMERLGRGESGLMELAQGFPLSLNGRFYPFVTSRNVTVSQGLSDMFLPLSVAGPLVINLRTLPIRINSKKFIGEDGRHLTWDEVEDGVPHTVYEGNSGGWYPDQEELTWDQVTKDSGSPDPIIEMTSVTKLPRRIATFSKENLAEAIKFNDTGRGVHLCLNFANYVDYDITGARSIYQLTDKVKNWVRDNLEEYSHLVSFLGTSALTNDMIEI